MTKMVHDTELGGCMGMRIKPILVFVVTTSTVVSLVVPWLPVASAVLIAAALATGHFGETSPRLVAYVLSVAVVMGILRYVFSMPDVLWFVGAEGSWSHMLAANTLSFFGAFILTIPFAIAVVMAGCRENSGTVPDFGPWC